MQKRYYGDLLSLWILALIESALKVSDDGAWRSLSARLCVLGYRVSADPLNDLRYGIGQVDEELSALESSVLSKKGTVPI